MREINCCKVIIYKLLSIKTKAMEDFQHVEHKGQTKNKYIKHLKSKAIERRIK